MLGNLCPGDPHQLSQDFLRIELQAESLTIQSSLLPSLLSQVSDLHCGQKAPPPIPDLSPLYLPQVFSPIHVLHI